MIYTLNSFFCLAKNVFYTFRLLYNCAYLSFPVFVIDINMRYLVIRYCKSFACTLIKQLQTSFLPNCQQSIFS